MLELPKKDTPLISSRVLKVFLFGSKIKGSNKCPEAVYATHPVKCGTFIASGIKGKQLFFLH